MKKVYCLKSHKQNCRREESITGRLCNILSKNQVDEEVIYIYSHCRIGQFAKLW